jgi:DNA-binding CsgD family transcriptional regulator
MNLDDIPPKRVSFPASPPFPMERIELIEKPLCLLKKLDDGEEILLRQYEWTSNTLEIHGKLLTLIEKYAHALHEAGKDQEAMYWVTLRCLARFAKRYPAMRKDHRQRDFIQSHGLPQREAKSWRDELAPLRQALSGVLPNADFAPPNHPTVANLVFEARYPDSSAMRESPEGLIPFVDETLSRELQEGERYIERLEQRGRRRPEVGLRLRQMKMVAERASVYLVGLTFLAILRQIRVHLKPEEQRWFSFMYLPNDKFHGAVLAFDPILVPLLNLADEELRKALVCFIALDDESVRDKVEGIVRTYLYGYPSYADRVIHLMRETGQARFRSEDSITPVLDDLLLERREDEQERVAVQLDSTTAAHRARLTSREEKVVALFDQGHNETEIGQCLKISQPMVHKHLKKAGEKIRKLRKESAAAPRP